MLLLSAMSLFSASRTALCRSSGAAAQSGASLSLSVPRLFHASGFSAARRSKGRGQLGQPKATAAKKGKEFQYEEIEEFLEEEDLSSEINTGNVKWGEVALATTNTVLGSDEEAFGGVNLFSLRAFPFKKRVDIRLDKLSDPYGAPTLEELTTFSRRFNAAFEEELGEEVAGQIEVEVSSPGAERVVAVPDDLLRFQKLPMKVQYTGAKADKPDVVTTAVLQLLEVTSEDSTTWAIGDVRENWTGAKGQRLTKKQKELRFEIPLENIVRVNLYIDF